MRGEQVLLFWISGLVTVFLGCHASKCMPDPSNLCEGWTLTSSGLCVRMTSNRIRFNQVEADCQKEGGVQLRKVNITDDVKACLVELHPHLKRKMVWVKGRKECTLYDLKTNANRYPGCKNKRFFACQKLPLPEPTTVITTEMPTTEEPTTEEPTTQEPTTQEPTTQEPTTEEPTTQEPTTEEPTTQEPTTEEPTTQETTEEPSTPRARIDELDIMDTSTYDPDLLHTDPTEPPSTVFTESTEFWDLQGFTEVTDSPPKEDPWAKDLWPILDQSETASTTASDTATTDDTTGSSDVVITTGSDVIGTDDAGASTDTVAYDAENSTTSEPGQTSEAPSCPQGFQGPVENLCFSVIREDKKMLEDASKACMEQGAELMAEDQLSDSVKAMLMDFKPDDQPSILRLEPGKCAHFNEDDVIESSNCSQDMELGFICAIDHAKTGGSTLGKAAPVAGTTLAVTSVAILVSVLVP